LFAISQTIKNKTGLGAGLPGWCHPYDTFDALMTILHNSFNAMDGLLDVKMKQYMGDS
jgi:hypothetical protein